MSRSGYSDDGENFAMWRGQVLLELANAPLSVSTPADADKDTGDAGK